VCKPFVYVCSRRGAAPWGPAAPPQRSLPLVTFKQRCPNSSRRLLDLAGRQKSKSRRSCLSRVAYLRDRTVLHVLFAMCYYHLGSLAVPPARPVGQPQVFYPPAARTSSTRLRSHLLYVRAEDVQLVLQRHHVQSVLDVFGSADPQAGVARVVPHLLHLIHDLEVQFVEASL
jgi:hypothetical protein